MWCSLPSSPNARLHLTQQKHSGCQFLSKAVTIFWKEEEESVRCESTFLDQISDVTEMTGGEGLTFRMGLLQWAQWGEKRVK